MKIPVTGEGSNDLLKNKGNIQFKRIIYQQSNLMRISDYVLYVINIHVIKMCKMFV